MVNDGGEIAVNVAAQDVGARIPITLVSLDGLMRTFAPTIGEAIGNETRLENRLDNGAKRMMHHPVAERCRGNNALLGIVHLYGDVAARQRLRSQLALKPQDFRFEFA